MAKYGIETTYSSTKVGSKPDADWNLNKAKLEWKPKAGSLNHRQAILHIKLCSHPDGEYVRPKTLMAKHYNLGVTSPSCIHHSTEIEGQERYYRNITANTIILLEAMAAHNVKTLIYSSTCATYGQPEKMPITEETPQVPINPYGKAKKMAEDIILDYSKKSNIGVTILRYFNVIGSDPEGLLGESPRPELREHGRISGACFDAALGIIPGLKVKGTDYETADGTCIRDYIDVTDLVDAHVKALNKAEPNKVGIYNVGTGKGRTVKEFVEACKKATGVDIQVEYLSRRPGDYAEVYSDPSKIQRELNWTAQNTDFLKSLQVAWKWQKYHRNGYGSPLAMAF